MKNLLNHKNRKSSYLAEFDKPEYKIKSAKSEDKFSTTEKWNCPNCQTHNISTAIASYTSASRTTYHYQCGKCNKFHSLWQFL